MREEYPFQTLPDYLKPGLDLVFIGINPGLYSVQQGHYFARKNSRFWPALSASVLSEPMRRKLGIDQLFPPHDALLPQFGIGLTDIVKRPSANASELTAKDFERWVPSLIEKIKHYAPRVACFHGITGYRSFLAHAFPNVKCQPMLGSQPEPPGHPALMGATRIYLVPNPSPANAHFTLADQTAWYDRLADFIASVKAN